MRLNIDCDLVKQLTGQRTASKEITSLRWVDTWACNMVMWYWSVAILFWHLSIDHIVNVQYKRHLPRHTWDTPPFLLIVSPTPPVQFVDACTYIRSVNHMTTKRKEVDHILWVWGSVPSIASRLWEPDYNSKWWRELMRHSQRYKKCWDNRNKDKRIITGRPHTVCLYIRFNCKFIVNVLDYIYRLLYL